jgi:hypothetical protein
MALRAISSISSISLDGEVQPKNHHNGISAFLCVSGHEHYEKNNPGNIDFFSFSDCHIWGSDFVRLTV